jgi:hypothetical protein
MSRFFQFLHMRGLKYMALLAMLGTLVITAPTMAAGPVIGDVVANLAPPELAAPYITITGMNFGKDSPTVQIGNYALPLGITSNTDTVVVATLPADSRW